MINFPIYRQEVTMADIRNTGTWQRVERGLSDMANLVSRGEYNLALVKSRQTMEQIVRLSAGQNFVVYTDLADTIEKLYQGHYITKSSRDAFHTIRMLGNKAVHEGDNDPQDAARSYRLLDQEINAFVSGGRSQEASADRERPAEQTPQRERSSQKEQKLNIPGERTRVPVSRESLPSSQGSRRRYDNLDDRSTRDRREVPNREDRLRAQRKGQPARGGAHRGQRKPQQQGISVYDVLRILIPVICVILLVVLIRSFMGGGSSAPETSPVQTETATEPVTEPVTAVPPTTEPETTTAAAVRYRIKGNGVNIRYADNENRVYEQLSNGTEIGEVEEVEGTNKVKFMRDGIEVTVDKNFIEPIEDVAAEPEAEAQTP